MDGKRAHKILIEESREGVEEDNIEASGEMSLGRTDRHPSKRYPTTDISMAV